MISAHTATQLLVEFLKTRHLVRKSSDCLSAAGIAGKMLVISNFCVWDIMIKTINIIVYMTKDR